jgi:uncharacterized membrane protein
MNKYRYLRAGAAVIIGILSVSAFAGLFYPLKIFDLQPTALLQRVLVDFSLFAVILAAALVFFTFLFGRIYCSVLCPLGLEIEADAVVVAVSPNDDVSAGFFDNGLSAVDKVKQGSAFKVEETFGKVFIKERKAQSFLSAEKPGQIFAAAAFNVIKKIDNDNFEFDGRARR